MTGKHLPPTVAGPARVQTKVQTSRGPTPNVQARIDLNPGGTSYGFFSVLLLVFCVTSAGSLLGQDRNFDAVSSTDVIGSGLPTVQLPTRGVPTTRTGGMSCRIQLGQELVVGYVATHITVVSQTKFASDRELLFRFRGVEDEVFPPRRNLEVDVPITVQQGTASQAFTRYLPRWAITRKMNIEVLEDGRVVPDLVAKVDSPLEAGWRPLNQRVSNAGLRYADVAMKSERELNPLLVLATDKPTKAETRLLKSIGNLIDGAAEVHPVSRMPTDWRAYQRFDVIFLSPSTCDQLVLRPDAFKAVQYWLMMGGTVVVPGDRAPETLMIQFGFSEGAPTVFDAQLEQDLEATWDRLESGWKLVLANLTDASPGDTQETIAAESFNAGSIPTGARFKAIEMLGDPDLTLEETVGRVRRKLQSLRRARGRTSRQWSERIWTRSVAAGLIIGLNAENKSGEAVDAESGEAAIAEFGEIEEPDLYVIFELIGYRVSPMLRRGVDPMIGDSRFRNWLIPGVAQPPVYTFIGLLTVFVILVGPVAYRQTARYRRSHLMFLIAPLLAVITTALMFAYGIMSDGFGTMARIRQLTLVDGVSGTGVDRIRSTYFAGVRPAEGLRFGGEDEVMAYPESERVAWADHLNQTPKLIGRVSIGENYQRFDAFFLPSRSQKQFVVHRPVPNIGSLRVSTKATTPATLNSDGMENQEGLSNPQRVTVLTNDFAFAIQRIVVRQSKEAYWVLDYLDSQSTARATLMDSRKVSKELGSLYNDFRPLMTASTETRNNMNSGKTTDLLREVMQSVDPSSATYDGVFEGQFRGRLQTGLEIPVGSFVAISSVSEDVVAVQKTEQVNCIRYIMGTFVEQ